MFIAEYDSKTPQSAYKHVHIAPHESIGRATLIQQHLDTGCIHPSNSANASPTFIVPKSDKTVLLRWVNDY
jgi:hypothetical protein